MLRQNSLLLLQRLIAIGNTNSNKDDQQGSDEISRMKMYRLEITSYIIGSCCNSVIKSGKITYKIFYSIKIYLRFYKNSRNVVSYLSRMK